MPPNSGRGGSRTPKAAKPTRFRDGVPRRWQPFQRKVAPAGFEPAPHRLRVGGSSVELQSHVDVTGRDRTCAASRFRRALYRAELRSHGLLGRRLRRRHRGGAGFAGATVCIGGAGVEPAASCVSGRCSAAELSAFGQWAELGSNQQPPVCRTGALPIELSARGQAPGQGVEPRSPRSERGILPLDDPGSMGAPTSEAPTPINC
jgi:hypothetical protein